MEKTVGILGGMGPYATLEFIKLIYQETPVKKDSEHLRIITDIHVKLPSRTRALLYGEQSPTKGMAESINNLAKIGADFVVVPCNSAEYFHAEVAPLISIPWPSIVEVTANSIMAKGKKCPLILGGYVTTRSKLYSNYLPEAVYLSDEHNRVIEKMIEEIKISSTLSVASVNIFESICNEYKTSFDCIVLACTEFPLVFREKQIFGFDTVNSSLEYAGYVVRYARA